MVRSVQLFTYDYPRGVGEIRNVLGSSKTIHYTRTDKRQAHFDEDLKLEGRITQITNSSFGIGGHFFYRYQEIVNRHMPDEHYAIFGEHYDFLISPKHKSLIVHGASLYRDHVKRLISETIHNGDARAFGNRIITKDQMKKLWTLYVNIMVIMTVKDRIIFFWIKNGKGLKIWTILPEKIVV